LVKSVKNRLRNGVFHAFGCIIVIHLFVAGNGRIGRAINNYILIREGYVPINIKFVDRKKYYEAFREFDSNHRTAIMKEIVTLREYARRKKLSHSNLINKANRQTIEAFLVKNEWKIGA